MAIMIVVLVVVIIFLGGIVNIGGRPVFGHIDRVIGASVFMTVHHVFFFFLESGEERVYSDIEDTEEDIKEFSKRPIGIDNQKKYRDLDHALDRDFKYK
jgi:hypothetical protein